MKFLMQNRACVVPAIIGKMKSCVCMLSINLHFYRKCSVWCRMWPSRMSQHHSVNIKAINFSHRVSLDFSCSEQFVLCLTWPKRTFPQCGINNVFVWPAGAFIMSFQCHSKHTAGKLIVGIIHQFYEQEWKVARHPCFFSIFTHLLHFCCVLQLKSVSHIIQNVTWVGLTLLSFSMKQSGLDF